MLDYYASIYFNPLKFVKFKYISNYMIIYVKMLKSSDHLDILHADD